MGSLRSQFKRYFFAGLLVTVPFVLTIWVIFLFISWTDNFLNFLPPAIHPRSILPIPGWGFIFTILLILFAGMLTHNIFGKRLLAFWDQQIEKIPLIRGIYGSARQILESLFVATGKHFQHVALIEYPRRGIYSIAFITGETKGFIEEATGKKLVSIFIPSTPNPTTGYYIMLPEEDVIKLDISVEDAAKLIISAGMFSDEKLDKKTSKKLNS